MKCKRGRHLRTPENTTAKGECRACRRERERWQRATNAPSAQRTRERQRAWRRKHAADPAWRAHQRQLKRESDRRISEDPEKVRARQEYRREYLRRKSADPKWRELRREYGRIYGEAKRRERGLPSRWDRKRPTVVDSIERTLLDSGPLLDLIHRRRASPVALARQARVSERTLRRLETGESRHVRLDVADKVCVALDTPLSLVYPEWLEAA